MNMEISQAAAAWFKRELDLKNGDYIRLFPVIAREVDFTPVFRWALLQKHLGVQLFRSNRMILCSIWRSRTYGIWKVMTYLSYTLSQRMTLNISTNQSRYPAKCRYSCLNDCLFNQEKPLPKGRGFSNAVFKMRVFQLEIHRCYQCKLREVSSSRAKSKSSISYT